MSRIGGKNTAPEKVVRSLLHGLGYRFRLHAAELPGSPDIVFRNRKKAIFVHGCFWHGHKGCVRAGLPKSNTSFWKKKISTNAARDEKNRKALRSMGWSILTIWQCETRDKESLSKCLSRFLSE